MNHIVFGDVAIGSLKHAFRKQDHKIIGLPTDFSVGPITNSHKKSGVTDHYDWLSKK